MCGAFKRIAFLADAGGVETAAWIALTGLSVLVLAHYAYDIWCWLELWRWERRKRDKAL